MIEEAEERMMKRPKSEQNYYKSHRRNRYEEKDRRHHREHFKKPQDSREYERTDFNDRSQFQFEFRKPGNENKHNKKLNQFKSTRSSNFYDYGEMLSDDENTKSSNSKHLNTEKISEIKRQDNRSMNSIDPSNREKRIPAWKKPKYAKEESKEDRILGKILLM